MAQDTKMLISAFIRQPPIIRARAAGRRRRNAREETASQPDKPKKCLTRRNALFVAHGIDRAVDPSQKKIRRLNLLAGAIVPLQPDENGVDLRREYVVRSACARRRSTILKPCRN